MKPIQHLKATDRTKYDKRYWEWVTDAPDYDWWDDVRNVFREDMTALGAYVDDIRFSLGYCQSDYAAWKGSIPFATWLKLAGYAETHLPLVLDAEEYGAQVKITLSGYCGASTAEVDYTPGNVAPCGVFKDLPQEGWDDLVSGQYNAEDWDTLITQWARGKSQELYRMLRDEYEYLTSEEQFEEWCNANEPEFLADIPEPAPA